MAFVPPALSGARPTLRRARARCGVCAAPAAARAAAPARACARAAVRAGPALDAPVKTDLGALERMFAAPAAAESVEKAARLDPGKKAKVMLLNDASNERSYVARVLQAVCPELSPDMAWKIMTQAHKHGSAVVGIYPFEQAELIVEQLRNNGLGSELREV